MNAVGYSFGTGITNCVTAYIQRHQHSIEGYTIGYGYSTFFLDFVAPQTQVLYLCNFDDRSNSRGANILDGVVP